MELHKNFKVKGLLAIACCLCVYFSPAQTTVDTTNSKELQLVMVKAWLRADVKPLPAETNGFLTAGKKTESITLTSINATLALKTGRQLFSKVPGVFVYDMDGSGNQVNISTRGLDPHRSWEFNLRQNGVVINSDMYGYPASHYSAPMESFERIDIIRGTGALQYGAQFGGLINYITKKPDSIKPITFESINTAGSFGLLSSYNAIGGTFRKFSYYTYYYRRHSKGFRKNSESDADAQFIQLQYRFNDKLSLKAEAGRSKYLYHIPGPLNDSMFYTNPEMSTRSRNYFSPDIYVPSLSLQWKLTHHTQMNIAASGVFGNRSSVQFDAFANVKDAIDSLTGKYKNRQVDIDRFHSRTVEARLLHEYSFYNVKGKLTAGIVYMNNNLHRRQLGKGTTGTDYDLTLAEPGFGRDIHFTSRNLAMFAENTFSINERLSISPGLRWEKGSSDMSGTIKYYPSTELPNTIDHEFVLAGVSIQYACGKANTFYGGFSQAYRLVIFKDIVPASTYEQIDKNLRDATGYNAEFGIRGKLFRSLQYDVSFFSLLYKNRMGTLVLQNNAGESYTYKTNIGNSRTNGIELFLQYKLRIANSLYAGIFTSTSYMNAEYTSGQVSSGSINKSIAGNKVESAPEWIGRNGLEILYKGFSCTILHNYTSSSYSDALNTVVPPTNGARGLTPAYSVWDFNASARINNIYSVKAGINNIFDKNYYTKRPAFYPGPGIWPSDGRNVYVTIGVKI